jgi:hypothetical protein
MTTKPIRRRNSSRFKTPFPGRGIFEPYRMNAERRQWRTQILGPAAGPPGIGALQTFSGRHINVGLDGMVEMPAEDAQYLIRVGWTKPVEWTTDEPA